MEQVITFIQFNNEDSSEITVQVLPVDNLLETHDSAIATAMFQTIQCNLQACTLPVVKLIGLATDGASDMVGRKNVLAAKLKDVKPRFSSLYMPQFSFALAWTDAKDDANLKFIKEVETVVTKLWKLL